MAKEERKIEILKAASRVFYYKGFEGTKIGDVAKEAGIGKGTVYEYFESKQQLFNEMVAYNRELHIQNINNTLKTGGDFRDKFIALARYQAQLVREHVAVFHNIACSKIIAREMGALFLEQNIRVADILKEHVIEGIKKGELRSDLDPDIAAALMMGIITQYCSKKVAFYNVLPEDMDYNKIVDTVLRGIGNHGN